MEAYVDPLKGGLLALLRDLDLQGPVEMVLVGVAGEALVAGSREVAILKAGYQALGSPLARRAERIDLGRVCSVKAGVSRMSGRLVISAEEASGVISQRTVHFPRAMADKFKIAAGILTQRVQEAREAAATLSPLPATHAAAPTQDAGRQSGGERTAPPPADPEGVLARMRTLKQLRQEELITGEEYVEKKRELLSAL